MKVFSAHVSLSPREAPPNLLAAPLPIRRTAWALPSATNTSSATTTTSLHHHSSPRVFPEASADLGQVPRDAMDDTHRIFSSRRPATETLPPFHMPPNPSPSYQVTGSGPHYLPSPSQHSPPTSLPNTNSYPLPSPSHQPSSAALSSSSYHVPTSGPQYQQLPSPTQHSPPTGNLGGSNDYHHAHSSGPNYTLSAPTYPVMAPPGQYRPPNFSYQQMPLPGGMSGMHHPQGQMALVQGNPHMQHMPQHYMYAAQQGQQQLDRPFKCDQCTQSFSRNHDLKRHKRIHLAVKPFPCTYCSKQFSRKDALKRHRLVKGCEEKAKNKEKELAAADGKDIGDSGDNGPHDMDSNGDNEEQGSMDMDNRPHPLSGH